MNVDGYIPKGYIEDEEQKIEIYKKIAAIEGYDDYSELLDELIDRFGDVPRGEKLDAGFLSQGLGQ